MDDSENAVFSLSVATVRTIDIGQFNLYDKSNENISLSSAAD